MKGGLLIVKFSTEKKYVINRVLNHNVVLCYDSILKKEFILIGKAIGFQKKAGDLVDLNLVTKIYEIKDPSNLSVYETLMSNCDEDIISVSEEIISRLEVRFGKNYNENLHVSLLDHLKFSIYRYKNNIPVQNIFMEEISSMYSEEYEFAREMVRFANEALNINLPEAEVAFICLHVHSALHNDTPSNSALYANMIAKCIVYIENKTKVKLAPKSVERQRLITHLKFAFKRAKEHVFINNPIAKSIKESYPETYRVASSLGKMLSEEFGIELPEGEIGYLALHIQNILMSGQQ